ncbi:PREDICTED: coiled-coil domain-containing protein 86 isoform X2 [Nicrophorus vespilloides]|uniref:Coiled-coil domain-containing protein 86 n=1 Tax=Nicrophorus vespilloides TaxID=110193 RepID=A0ABM1MUX3_NICVS|nr:PREDICTED: coiled-coil domain-containing protein 86 isoform X2 [Nicrophorus vespilloides]
MAKVTNKVVKLEDILGDKKKIEESKDVDKKVPEVKRTPVVRGQPKSGRFWKSEKQKFSRIVKVKGLKNSFERKEALRNDLKRVREISKQAKEAQLAAKEEKKERRRENMKRKEENTKKSEIVQVITNTNKIKRMKKKQLRYIQKRDTTTVG